MDLDVIMLSRIQFAFTIGYHIVFPSMSIGLAQYLAFLEFNELRTAGTPKSASYRQRFDFWARIFALSFGMGVVSGVVLSYEIGTNWGKFSELAGPIVGPLMSFEVMTAFFLEAGFLGIMLLGRRRVGAKLHFFATCMVAFGTLMSAFWILSANSWMHTPAGYQMVGEAIHPANWLEAIFNPSFPYRYAHMVTAALLSSCFVVAAVGAWYLVQGRETEFAKATLKNALFTAALLTPLQIFIGDLHGINTQEHQPMKVAAMEGRWDTMAGAPLLLLAIPDEEAERNSFEIGIPKLASLILTHELDGVVRGLKEVPPEDRPPMLLPFYSFRLMVACGLLMLLFAWWGSLQAWRGKLLEQRRYLSVLQFMAPIGFVAVIAGWITTEVGRQPWTVYGLIRTKDAATVVPGSNVALTLCLFIVVYAVLFYGFVKFFRYLLRKGPDEKHEMDDPVKGGRHAFVTELDDD